MQREQQQHGIARNNKIEKRERGTEGVIIPNAWSKSSSYTVSHTISLLTSIFRNFTPPSSKIFADASSIA
jgi:hypothetical protein